MSTQLARADITKHLSYTVTKETTKEGGTKDILRLSEGTSRSAGYLELDNPDATPLVPAFAIALRREVWIDAGVLAGSLKRPIEIHASDAAGKSWCVGRISPSTSLKAIGALGGAYQEAQGRVDLDLEPRNEGHAVGTEKGSE